MFPNTAIYDKYNKEFGELCLDKYILTENNTDLINLLNNISLQGLHNGFLDACTVGNMNMIKYLCENYKEYLSSVINRGFVNASNNHHIDIMKYLYENADIDLLYDRSCAYLNAYHHSKCGFYHDIFKFYLERIDNSMFNKINSE